MKASPATSLEVVQPELAFEFLVVALDPPADLRKPHQLRSGSVGRHRGEPGLRWGGLPLGPLDEKPLDVPRPVEVFVPVGRPYAQQGEARAHRAAGPLPPRDRAPSPKGKLLRESVDSDGAMAARAPPPRRA